MGTGRPQVRCRIRRAFRPARAVDADPDRRRETLPRCALALDQYSGDLAGVSVVEVEFGSESDATRFSPPTWFGREVTGEPGWANQRLAVAGEPAKRAEYRVRPDEEPGSGVARVIAARTAQAAAAVRRADSSAAVADEVHEARKAIKKARSALRLLRGVISDDEREASNRGLRRAARSLSGARDAEVKLATLGTIGDFDPEPYGLTVWRIHLQGEAERHRGELSGPRLAEAGAAIEAVGARYRGRRLPGAASRIAENAARGYRRGRRAMKDARGSLDPEGFHGWRKRAKDLRYQLEILGPRLPERFDEARAGAEGLADQLGELHDLDVLAADLSARPMDPVHRERLAEALAVARERLAQVCLERGKGLYREKPSRFAEGLAASLVGGS